MYKVAKEFRFCAAHRLPHHGGKCKSLHGHNYRVFVTFRAHDLGKNGMVIDFDAITKTVGEWIAVRLDHTTLVSPSDQALTEFVYSQNAKDPFICEKGETTAENLAAAIADRCAHLAGMYNGVEVDNVTVFETDTCAAVYAPQNPDELPVP